MPRFEEEIHMERIGWFINMRWAAVVGGMVLLVLGPVVAPLNLFYGRLIACVVGLGLLNAGYLLYWERLKASGHKPEALAEQAGGLLHLQMLVDLLLLTLMLFLSGGAQNPLFLLYLFHLAISAMVFSASESLFYAALAAGLPWVLYFAERSGSGFDFLSRDHGGISQAHEIALLSAYTLAVGGLWFFLSRLALDLRVKEKALRQAGESLTLANAELKQLDLFKSRFLRQVVFQLKSPAIEMDFDLSAVEKNLPPDHSKALESVKNAKKRVWSFLELIEDLVWLSKIEAGEFTFRQEWVDVYETLLKRVQALEAEATRKGVVFKVHGDSRTRLFADRSSFEKVAEKLLANAVKYTPPGDHPILVEFKDFDGWLVLTVEDQGIGVPPKQQAKLFQEFFRATNAKAVEKTGTGLGLSIVKRIMGLHGGRVELTSVPHQGTKVETWWPHPLDPEAREAQTESNSP